MIAADTSYVQISKLSMAKEQPIVNEKKSAKTIANFIATFLKVALSNNFFIIKTLDKPRELNN